MMRLVVYNVVVTRVVERNGSGGGVYTEPVVGVYSVGGNMVVRQTSVMVVRVKVPYLIEVLVIVVEAS